MKDKDQEYIDKWLQEQRDWLEEEIDKIERERIELHEPELDDKVLELLRREEACAKGYLEHLRDRSRLWSWERDWEPKQWLLNIHTLRKSRFMEAYGYLMKNCLSLYKTEQTYDEYGLPFHLKGKGDYFHADSEGVTKHYHVLVIPNYQEMAKAMDRTLRLAQKYTYTFCKQHILMRLDRKTGEHGQYFYSLGYWDEYRYKDEKIGEWTIGDVKRYWLKKELHEQWLWQFKV